MGEKLYNNIQLPDEWPPKDRDLSSSMPQRIPYLEKRPDVVDIDVGRQLFVDDFLTERRGTTMARKFHQPVKYPGNPVFFPQTSQECNEEKAPCAIPKSGGIWYDTSEQLFKMWYMASYLGTACYATSKDGISWERPELDIIPGTNIVLPENIHPDSGSVVIDYFTQNPQERYKCLVREPNPLEYKGDIPGLLLTSADGIHWSESRKTGIMGDRSTMFYNPFRKKWIQSIRDLYSDVGRFRRYREHEDFIQSGQWKDKADNVPWLRADCMDESCDSNPELYAFDAIAYESVMLGFSMILKGPPNHIGEASGLPKLTDLTVGYSRDGFHFHSADRRSFIEARREPGSWEYGYLEPSAGMCHIVGDELWIYYTAYAGDPKRAKTSNWYINGTYTNGAMGLAKLRRDGFASMQARFAGSTITTRPVQFSGKHLFVNANTVGDKLRVEVQNENYETIPGFTFDDCIGYMGNSTAGEIRWKDASLDSLSGIPVRFVFQMDRGDLYAFWVSKDESGKSNGYVGAGGPGFTGPIDC